MLQQTPIPFLDLRALHEGLKEQLLDEIAELIDSGAFIIGPQVREFEGAFAAHAGSEHCVGVASGLDALRLALLAAGIEQGDEVVVPSMTFVATLEAVSQAGGRPVIAEVSELDCNLDPAAAAAAFTPRTRFLLPVHLYGQLADMRALTSLAERHGVQIIEDACQAHGAERDGLRAGAVGLAGAFSFYPGKNLGAIGDAGALVTDDDGLAARVRALREHGQSVKYEHAEPGYTARLDTIQAIALSHKLPLLDGWNDERRAAARRYRELLDGIGDLVLPRTAPGSNPVWHLYVVRTGDPAALGEFLRERGVQSGRHYPQPAHLSQAYASLGHRAGAFPVAEAIGAEALSLPLYPGITEGQQEAVAEAVAAYFSRG